jgi:hypothetical protein
MMGFIPDRPQSFMRQLEKRFNRALPEGVSIFYAEGIRVGHSTLRQSDIHGERGYGACDNSFVPTNAFIQNFGHLAKRNVIELDEAEAKAFASGKDIPRDAGDKQRYVVVRYKAHTVGLGFYNGPKKTLENRIPEKRRREIINSI